jgi:hypothetical protein
MARDVNKLGPVRDDLDALADELVDDVADRLLVAGIARDEKMTLSPFESAMSG